MSIAVRFVLSIVFYALCLMSPAQRAVAETAGLVGIDLARLHFQELIPVLDHLQVISPPQYEKAVRDLDRSAKKLESIRRRDKRLYEVALREWKTRGQIDLLKAKLKVKASESDRKAVLEHLRTLRETELERISRELVLLDERDAANKDRMRQLNQAIEHGESLRSQLKKHRERLQLETIDQDSPVYLKAIGTKSSSKKVGNE